MFRYRVLSVALALLPIFVLTLPAQDVDERAEANLKSLAEKIDAPTGDKEKTRAEVLIFMRRYGGTSYAARAGALLMKLPSPLDKLDPATIPAIEKFSWQAKEQVAILGEHRGRQGAAATCVAFSPDGTMIASGGSYYLRLWDAATMRLRAYFGHGYYVTSVAFSRDNKVLASGNTNGQLAVWDIQPGEKLPTQRFVVTVGTAGIAGLAFSPNGKTVACACGDNVTRLYDVTGKEAKEQAIIQGHDKPLHAVAYTHDGKTLATGGDDLNIRLWNAVPEIPTEKSVLKGAASAILSLAFNPAGNTLAAGTTDGKIYLYNVPGTGKARATFEAKGSGSVNGVSFSSSGNTLAAACYDNSIRLFNMALSPPRERFRLDGHVSPVTAVAYSPDSKLIASAGADWMVRTWDSSGATTPRERFVPTSHLGYTYSTAFTPDAASLASGSIDGSVRVWDLTKPEPKTRHYLRSAAKADIGSQVHKVAISPDGKLLAAGTNGKKIRQYDPTTGKSMRPCPDEGMQCQSLAYTPDSKALLFSGNQQKEVVQFDAATGNEMRRYGMHDVGINCVAVGPDGKLLATGAGYYELDKMGRPVLDKMNRYVYKDCTLRLWDLETAKEQHIVKSATVPIYSLAFAPDGRRLFSGAYEPTLRKRETADPTNSEAILIKDGSHSGYAAGLIVTPDGKHVITAGLDYRIMVWDADTGKMVYQWYSNEQIASISLANDGRHLAVSVQTGVVYVLRLNPSALAPASASAPK